jgi:hypothetical protein
MAKEKLDCPIDVFIDAWEGSDTIEEVRVKLGAKSAQAVFLRAAMYRKAEIPLKVFPPKVPVNKAPVIDVEAGLKALAKIRGVKLAVLKEEGKKRAEEIKTALAEKKAKTKAAETT